MRATVAGTSVVIIESAMYHVKCEFSFALSQKQTQKKQIDHLEENISGVNISENKYVIIPQHLRAPRVDHTRLMFGRFEMEFDYTKSISSGFQGIAN
ncbi:hypothetical protein AQUCO_00800280v1 [Aquilegia coerulea]|uniref:Uncharacterized protein n=1 Tax=Aquilegia coerulea TaxID=218851 RepID=A0A2G5EI03_AQUCA|nr:hypothetical protein AQUCO_00800280v1 [Aquilegia coerulea]